MANARNKRGDNKHKKSVMPKMNKYLPKRRQLIKLYQQLYVLTGGARNDKAGWRQVQELDGNAPNGTAEKYKFFSDAVFDADLQLHRLQKGEAAVIDPLPVQENDVIPLNFQFNNFLEKIPDTYPIKIKTDSSNLDESVIDVKEEPLVPDTYTINVKDELIGSDLYDKCMKKELSDINVYSENLKNQPLCSICLNNYDSLQHRPRALPCGHGFCTQCIEACIRNEDRNCPICRAPHWKNSVHDLPISFLLEELLDKTASAPYESDEELEASAPYASDGEPSVDMCPRHKQVPLHFLCKSHKIKVCHRCNVIDHAPPSCVLISVKDLVIEKKRSQIAAVQVQRKKIMILEEDLNCLHQMTIDGVTKHRSRKNELQKEVDLLLAKIEEVDKEIFVIHESEEHIKGAIQSCHAKQKECEIVENKLKATKDTKTIKEEIQNAAEEIIMFQRWEEDLRNEHEMLKNRYAKFERNGIVRSSKVIFEGAKTLIPSLSKEVIPPISAELMQIPKTFKEADVYMTSSTTTVFLELSARGAEVGGGDLGLGRVEIRVLTDRPIGKQFVMIALGTDGISYKGANFEWKYSNCMGLQYYVTEDNTKAETPLLVTIEKEYEETYKIGRIYAIGVNRTGFVIRTRNMSDPRSDYGHFGDVITGMDVIDRAVSNEFAIKDIIISNCGLLVYEAAGYSYSNQNQQTSARNSPKKEHSKKLCSQ